MEFFLERIARSLRDEFGNTLNRHCLVFPGRRAGLYLLKYLSKGIAKPVWVPATYTINELFRTLSPLQIAGNELLLLELYKVYLSFKKDVGSFDDFYFWGDMLINDFDDTDKYLADASGLFGNIKDLREIDIRFGGLTEEQKEIIKRFWSNFGFEKPTDQKSGFLSLWSLMFDLYTDFRKTLRNRNLAYEGMIFRDVAEQTDAELADSVKWDMIHFIGFNALNNCEKRLMMALRKAGKARFYWDYDNSYMGTANHNSAGYFMNGNLTQFRNDMPCDWSYETMLSSGKAAKRVVIETSSDVTQVKLVPELLAKIPDLSPENAHNTAVVLSDESLLVPLLSSLPGNFTDINITMGYPLRQSVIYTLVTELADLQRTSREQNATVSFHSPRVLNVVRHPLISQMLDAEDNKLIDKIFSGNIAWATGKDFESSELLSGIFVKHTEPALLSEWFRNILSLIALKPGSDTETTELNVRNEMIYRIVLSLNRLEAVTGDPAVTFSAETFLRLFERLLRGQSVPFSGEPLSGIQVMGILETRALDFKNLIILSVNEGVMPSLSSSSSFIPFSLRQAFGLPSVNHQESVFSYHFYRLLQRAENVTFTYNSNSEGLRSGEMSRFLIQMNFSKDMRPEFRNQEFEIRTPSRPGECVPRTGEHVKMLEDRFLTGVGRLLSPSAINTWLNCRMKFCFRYVYGIREPETIAMEIDPAMFGNILHDIMKRLYKKYSGGVITTEIINNLIRDKQRLQEVVNEAIRGEFRNSEGSQVSGNELIVREVLNAYLERILQLDGSVAPVTILHLEQQFDFHVDIESGNKTIRVKTGGVADRIDMINGRVRLVDYKTGIISESISSIEELVKEDRKKDHDGWLQILLYCEAYLRESNTAQIAPSIYKIKKMTGKAFTDSLVIREGRTESTVDDYSLVLEGIVNGLTEVITKIFNPAEPFTMTADTSKCRYCPYSILCFR